MNLALAARAMGAPQPQLAVLFVEWKALAEVESDSDEVNEAAAARRGEIATQMALIRSGNAEDLSMKILVASLMGEAEIVDDGALGSSVLSDAGMFAKGVK